MFSKENYKSIINLRTVYLKRNSVVLIENWISILQLVPVLLRVFRSPGNQVIHTGGEKRRENMRKVGSDGLGTFASAPRFTVVFFLYGGVACELTTTNFLGKYLPNMNTFCDWLFETKVISVHDSFF